jgi:hypothetical protein
MQIFVLCIETKHGNDLFAFSSHTQAVNRLYKYVQDWWSTVCDGECPEDKEKAILEYFDSPDLGEWYTIEPVELDNEYI